MGQMNGQVSNCTGLVRGSNEGTITSSSTTVTISATAGYSVGGLVGQSGAAISNSLSAGSIKVTSSIDGAVVGGLVGANDGSISNSRSSASGVNSLNGGGWANELSDPKRCQDAVLSEWPRRLALWGNKAVLESKLKYIIERLRPDGLILNIECGGIPFEMTSPQCAFSRNV